MATYRCIIENIIKTKNYIFFQKNENENINENIDNKFKILFLTFLNQEYSVKNKFRFFYKILHNFWIKREEGEHDKFIDYFCKIQKTYNILNRFAYAYKWKKAKMVVNMDMGLNELRENDKNIICSIPVNINSYGIINYKNENNFKVNTFRNEITELILQFTDQNGYNINFNGVQWSIVLQLDIINFVV